MKIDIIEILIRCFAAVLIGTIIGSERARHGRAAGIRTHILVCLGSCMTSMTSVFVFETFATGDVFRIPAQVVSGIGFLGAGMIILKNDDKITGLTTAAGVWATGCIGVALGYGFYLGAAMVTVFSLVAVVLFARLEKRKKSSEMVYIELDDLYKVNEILEKLPSVIPSSYSYNVVPAKSGKDGNVGLSLAIDKQCNLDFAALCEIPGVVYAIDL